jgi:hypothetical protein
MLFWVIYQPNQDPMSSTTPPTASTTVSVAPVTAPPNRVDDLARTFGNAIYDLSSPFQKPTNRVTGKAYGVA